MREDREVMHDYGLRAAYCVLRTAYSQLMESWTTVLDAIQIGYSTQHPVRSTVPARPHIATRCFVRSSS